MQYALLIYTTEPTEAVPDDVIAAQTEAYNAFGEDIQAKGAFRAGEALLPTTSATTVRVQDGKVLATDGPFAETKEALGGFYLIEAADLDEAIAWAARIPGASYGSVEIRPVWDFSGAATGSPTTGAGASN